MSSSFRAATVGRTAINPSGVGPFDSGAEVRRAVGTVGHTKEGRAALLQTVLDEAGVERAHYGERVVLWLAGTSPETVGVIAGWIARSHGAADVRSLGELLARGRDD